MKPIVCLSLILLLLFTACGRQKTSGDDGPNPDVQVTETQSQPDTEPGEEITAVSVPDAQEAPETEAPTQEATKPTQETTKPTAAETTQPELPTTGTGTTITGTFIVKQVQGTLLTLHMYDPAKGGELKSGAYTADYGRLDGSDQMHFNVGDVVTVRYDQEVAETYPMQLTVREIYPAAWND